MSTALFTALLFVQPAGGAVGFRVVHETDPSRPTRAPVDFRGTPNRDWSGWPIHIGVWYPARAGTGRPMTVGSYRVRPVSESGAPTPPDSAAGEIRMMIERGLRRTVTEAEARTIAATPVAARFEAEPIGGRFPTIVAGSYFSLQAGAALFERLAASGYVVVAIASARTVNGLQLNRPGLGLEARVRDLEYAVGYASRLPNADPASLGLVGINADGMAVAAHQMKHMTARAVLSLDGWEGKRTGIGTVRDSPYFDPVRMRGAWMLVLQHEPNPPPSLAPDPGLFEAFRFADRYSLMIEQVGHLHLTVDTRGFPLRAAERAGLEAILRRSSAFFDVHLKGNTSQRGILGDSTLEEGRYLQNLAAEAKPAVPTADEGEALIFDRREVATLVSVVRAAATANPPERLFPYWQIRNWAFRLRLSQRRDEALALYRLNTEVYPGRSAGHEELGNLLLESGDSASARASLSRAADVVSSDEAIPVASRDSVRAALRARSAGIR